MAASDTPTATQSPTPTPLMAPVPDGSARSFYNSGTTALQGGQIGTALAYLEKAAHLAPGDPDIRVNLHIAQVQLGKVLGESKLDPGASSLDRWTETAPLGSLAALASLGAAALLGWSLWVRMKKRPYVSAALAGGLSLVVALSLTWIQYSTEHAGAAVALSRTPLRSGPGEQYPQVSQVEAGVKVRLSDDAPAPDAAWIQVRYSEEGVAWAPSGSLLRL